MFVDSCKYTTLQTRLSSISGVIFKEFSVREGVFFQTGWQVGKFAKAYITEVTVVTVFQIPNSYINTLINSYNYIYNYRFLGMFFIRNK